MFNFDEVIDRRNSSSLKWRSETNHFSGLPARADLLPMWIADMDFRVAEPITEALQREIGSGILGYGYTPESYREAVVGWQRRRFGWQVGTECVVQTPGVGHSVNMAIQAFTQPGDIIAVLTPVYIHLHYDVILNDRQLTTIPLTHADNTYRFDAEVFERALLPGTKMFILCNPHNPTGNVWSRDELRTIASICQERNILVVSDEVHQDLIFAEGMRHIPFASLSEHSANHSVICTGPSKTFNTAGLQCANVFIVNPVLRKAFTLQLERCGMAMNNTMGTVACEAAYRYGEPWADAMLGYIGANRRHFASRAKALGLPFSVTRADALYLAWLDFRSLNMTSQELHELLVKDAGIWLDIGTKYNDGGEGFMRINLACPRERIEDALSRLARIA